jgi:membrane-associated phospholipid phosphatase
VLLSASLLLFAASLPVDFWSYLASTFRDHTGLITLLLLFGLVAISLVWKAGQTIDAAVFRVFNRRKRHPLWLDNLMRLITEFGNSIVTTLLAVFLAVYVDRAVAYSFVLGSLMLWLIVETVKVLLRRSRPFTALQDVRVVGEKARGKSFPSGHTCQAFFTATLLLRHYDGGALYYLLLYALAGLVGVTRMYLGMHYPRDVLGGAVLGTFWGMIGLTVNSHILDLLGK